MSSRNPDYFSPPPATPKPDPPPPPSQPPSSSQHPSPPSSYSSPSSSPGPLSTASSSWSSTPGPPPSPPQQNPQLLEQADYELALVLSQLLDRRAPPPSQHQEQQQDPRVQPHIEEEHMMYMAIEHEEMELVQKRPISKRIYSTPPEDLFFHFPQPDSPYFGDDEDATTAENEVLDAFYASRATQQEANEAEFEKDNVESLPSNKGKSKVLFEESEGDDDDDDEERNNNLNILFRRSESEEQDDITTLKFLLSYRSDGGYLSFLLNVGDTATTSSGNSGFLDPFFSLRGFWDPVRDYINHFLPRGEKQVNEQQLRIKLLRLWNTFLAMLDTYNESPDLDQDMSRTNYDREMFHLLRRVWTEPPGSDSAVGRNTKANDADPKSKPNKLADVHMENKKETLNIVENADKQPADAIVPETAAEIHLEVCPDIHPEYLDVPMEEATEVVTLQPFDARVEEATEVDRPKLFDVRVEEATEVVRPKVINVQVKEAVEIVQDPNLIDVPMEEYSDTDRPRLFDVPVQEAAHTQPMNLEPEPSDNILK